MGGVTVTNIPGGNTRGTQRPDLVPGVNPYLKDGVRWLNPAAFAAPMPGTFGNLPRNFLRGPEFWQLDLMVSKDVRFAANQGAAAAPRDVQHHQPSELREPGGGAAGRHRRPAVHRRASPARSATCSGPLNRTVGLGTARQTQLSVRFLF